MVNLGFPEFTRYGRDPSKMLATSILGEYSTAEAIAKSTPRDLAKVRYDGRHAIGTKVAEASTAAARRLTGQRRGPVYRFQAHDIPQNIDLWRRRFADSEGDIEGPLDEQEVCSRLTWIDGLSSQTATRLIAELGDIARFPGSGTLAAYVGVIPRLRQSGQ